MWQGSQYENYIDLFLFKAIRNIYKYMKRTLTIHSYKMHKESHTRFTNLEKTT